MNVLFIANCVTEYGANLSMVDLIYQLSAIGHQCYVVLPYNGPIERVFREKKIKYCIVPFEVCAHYENQYSVKRKREFYYRNILLLPQIKRYIDKWKIDVIHTNASNVDFGSLIALRYRVPHVWHVREMLFDDYQLVYDFDAVTKFLLRMSDKVLCISNFIAQARGITGKNTEVLWDGIDIQKYMIHKTRNFIEDGCIRLFFAGNINESKGVMDAARATEILVHKYKLKVHLVIAGGESPYLMKLKRYIKSREMEDYIEYIGYQSDLSAYRSGTDIALMCSRSEGLGRVTVESMLSGALVVGADAGATSELITEGVNGYLYKAGDVFELAQKIKYAANNKAESKVIINSAKDFVIENFESSSYAIKISEIYKEVEKKYWYRRKR